MSFVSKILEHSGQLERRAVHKDMETLIQKQRELQFEVHQLAENKFNHFHPSLTESEKQKQRVEDFRKNVSGLEDKINNEIKGQLSLSTAEFQSLTKQLSESKAIGEALEHLSQVYTLHESAVKALNDNKYSEAVSALNKLDKLFKHPLCDHDDKINIYETMKQEAFTNRMKVEQDMAEMWADIVKWNFPKEKDSSNAKDDFPPAVSLNVGKEGFEKSVLNELIEGLYMTNLLNLRMKTFSERFQKFIVPLILEPHAVEANRTASQEEYRQTLNIAVSSVHDASSAGGKSKSSKQNSKKKSDSISENHLYITVFERFINVLEHLHEMLLSTKFGQHGDTGGSLEDSLMGLLGRETSENLLNILQKEILAKAIPTSAKDLAGFENVKTATYNLHEKLVTLGYISPDYRALKESVENVNLLFSNKKCALILTEARDLMTSDLLNQTSVVNENKPQEDLPMLTKTQSKGKKPQAQSDKLLSNDTFKLPDCHISENIMLLMQLAYTTLHEASESSPECATQMYFAVHRMFELFCHVVPTHHRQNIEKLPQMAALHHNNCMYIAHHLMTLGHQFALALPSSKSVTFVSLITHIREDGSNCLQAQIKRQKDILLECLDESDGFSSVEEDANRAKCERAVRQVLHQLNHLHKVWQPVLPVNVYQKVIGKLMQAVVERMTDYITAMEDITQEACLHLTVIIGPLEEDCAHVMGVNAAVLPCHVQNWQRLKDVKTVLNSSLLDIDNLWSEGKGPLALSFSPKEMKQMIRALFQNTDRRADVLSRIRFLLKNNILFTFWGTSLALL